MTVWKWAKDEDGRGGYVVTPRDAADVAVDRKIAGPPGLTGAAAGKPDDD